jgi:hypothetical protein
MILKDIKKKTTTITIVFILLFFSLSCRDNSCNDNIDHRFQWLGSIEVDDEVHDIVLDDNILYIAGDWDIDIIDVSDPKTPQQIGSIDSSFVDSADLFLNMEVLGDILYVLVHRGCPGWCIGDMIELRIFDISQPEAPVLLSVTGIPGKDILIDGNYLYASVQSNFSMQTLFSVIDVSDPQTPQKKASIDIPSPGNLSKIGDTIFLTATGLSGFEGIIGINVSDPLNPTPFFERTSSAYNVGSTPFSVYGTFGYVPMGQNGVQIFDLSDPENIHALTTLSTLSPSNTIQINDSCMYISTGDGIEIFDITNPTNPLFIKEMLTGSTAKLISISGALGVVVTENIMESGENGSGALIENEKVNLFSTH